MFNYNHLYYFYVTARLGGVSNAAKFLRISQPSLSSQLKVLEGELNKKLFVKQGRRLQLTPDGESAFAYCKKIFGVAEELAESLKTRADHHTRRISIGISDQVERPFIADLLSPMLRDRRGPMEKIISVTSATDEELLKKLRSREIDLLLTNKPVYSEDVRELAAVSMPVNLMVSSQNLKTTRLRVTRNTSAAEFLSTCPWGLVIPSYKLKLRHETDLFFQELKTRKKIIFESDILSVVGRAIIDGAGVGFLPVPYAYEEIKMGMVTVIGPKTGYWKHTLYLIGRQETGEYDSLIQEVRKSVRLLEKMI
ncbi:Transcriptional activator protein NhaR [compost metagenome]